MAGWLFMVVLMLKKWKNTMPMHSHRTLLIVGTPLSLLLYKKKSVEPSFWAFSTGPLSTFSFFCCSSFFFSNVLQLILGMAPLPATNSSPHGWVFKQFEQEERLQRLHLERGSCFLQHKAHVTTIASHHHCKTGYWTRGWPPVSGTDNPVAGLLGWTKAVGSLSSSKDSE